MDFPLHMVGEEVKKGLFQLRSKLFIERSNGPMDKFGDENIITCVSIESRAREGRHFVKKSDFSAGCSPINTFLTHNTVF